jgi:hypothetical protein
MKKRVSQEEPVKVRQEKMTLCNRNGERDADSATPTATAVPPTVIVSMPRRAFL